jgi:hypothetical protein
MKRKLFFLLCALLTSVGMWAQVTWNAPEVPGVDPLENPDVDLYLYNIEADAFVNSGMNWGTQAIATRLQSGDASASARHQLQVKNVNGSNFNIKLNNIRNNHGGSKGINTTNNNDNALLFCGNGTTNDVWVDNNTNPTWTAAASANYTNAYTLENAKHSGKKLDVQWLYGGRLTLDNGQGFTDWAFIPAESIANESYAIYKERRAMYAIYKELANNGKASTYAAALESANAVYVNAAATKDDLRAATRTLLIAVADGIENPVNANALFTNADILGNNISSDWSGDFTATNGVFERFHATVTLQQSKTDLPNGLYDVTFHGLYRQDDGKDQAAPRLTVTGTNVLEDDLNLISNLAPKWAVSNGFREYAWEWGGQQWTNSGSSVPDHQWGANQAMALDDAVATINNVQVKGNSLTIELAITGENQWVLFQGFDIVYNGPINVAVYKRLMEKKAEAEALVGEPMDPTVLSNLEGCIAVAETMTPNSDEDDLNNAYDNLVAAINDAEASIELTAHIKAITDNKGDLTSMINGTFDANADGWSGYTNYPTTLGRNWRGEGANPFIERNADGTMTTTVPNMPAGTYKVVAAARTYTGGKIKAQVAGGAYGEELTGTGDAAPDNGTMEINTNGVEMPYSSLGGFTTVGTGHNWHWISATGTLAADGNLVINFVATGTSWMAIDDVHLYCTNLGENAYTTSLNNISTNADVANAGGGVVTCDITVTNPNVVFKSNSGAAITTAAGQNLNNCLYNTSAWYMTKMILYDGYEFEDYLVSHGGYKYYATADGDASCTLYRNIPANTWCTLTIPFWPKTTLEKKYPSSFNSETGTLSFADVTNETCWNNEPMLIRSATPLTAITGKRAGIGGGASGVDYGDMTSGEGVPMKGVYEVGTVPVSEENYTRYAVVSGELHKVSGTAVVNIKPFRAYFELYDGSGNAREVIAFDIDGTTAINTIEAADAETEDGLKDGKYIIGNKVVIVKNGVKYGTNGQKMN